MNALERSLHDLRAVVAHAGKAAPSVSDWSVGAHIHHCCLSMIGIVRSLERSTPPPPPSSPSVARTAVFMSGRIPRGRVKSPPPVVPTAPIPSAELLALIDKSEQLFGVANTLAADTWITHPALGVLKRDDALKFARIHNRHHLRIVSDILKGWRMRVDG